MVMNESVENYLETILVLNHRLGNVRSIDIANEMNFKKPSVSVAMKNLRENGFITVSPEGYIHLTESGREVAEKIYERHTTLSSWSCWGLIPALQQKMHVRLNMMSAPKVLKRSNVT